MDNLRRAFRSFVIERMAFDLEQGNYDSILKMFIDGKISPEYGDKLQINFGVTLVPNDIFVFRELAGFEKDDSVLERIKSLWEKALAIS